MASSSDHAFRISNQPVLKPPLGNRPALVTGNVLCPSGFLELDVSHVEVVHEDPMLDRRSLGPSQWTVDRLCSDSTFQSRPDSQSRRPKGFFALVFGRERRTSLSAVIVVRTRAHIVIEFPEAQVAVKPTIVARELKACMVQALEVRIRRFLEAEHGDEKLQERVRHASASWDMQVVIEYRYRGFGFYPDPQADGPPVRRRFPFAIVYFANPDGRDLASETVFAQPLRLRGWRLAEISATPTLQFLEDAGIRTSSGCSVDLLNLKFPTNFRFTTDIEAVMDFNPMDVRPVFSASFSKTLGADNQPRLLIHESPAPSRSPFVCIENQTSIPKSKIAFIDYETITKRERSFPDPKVPEDVVFSASIAILDTCGSSPVVHGYVLCLPGVSRKRHEIEEVTPPPSPLLFRTRLWMIFRFCMHKCVFSCVYIRHLTPPLSSLNAKPRAKYSRGKGTSCTSSTTLTQSVDGTTPVTTCLTLKRDSSS